MKTIRMILLSATLLAASCLMAQEYGGERFQPQLNPEISVLGDFLFVTSDTDREESNMRLFELGFQSPLDPYTRFKLFLHIHKHPEAGEEHTNEYDLDVGEGYITYVGLPGHITLDLGKFRQQFGTLNRWHIHGLPLAEELLPLQKFFGEHGLAQTGISLSTSFSTPIASANEVTLQITNSENDRAFAGADFQRPAYLLHWKNYWDVTTASYLEWGLTALSGTDAANDTATYYGTDISYLWAPLGREMYRNFSVRMEAMDRRAQKEDHYGGALIVESRLSSHWIVGAAYQYAEEPDNSNWHTEKSSAILTFWQSPFVRLRAEYDHVDPNFGESSNQFLFQLTFAAGPHKHDIY